MPHSILKALTLWRKKLEFLLAKEAMISDPLKIFDIQQNIEECKIKIQELEQQIGILNNLPQRKYNRFFGRSDEISRILSYLQADRGIHVITITGIGGVGKTSLAMEVAHRCLEAREKNDGSAPYFDAIIFNTAKQQYLENEHILTSHHLPLTLLGIIRQIAKILEYDYIAQLNKDEQLKRTNDFVKDLKILLIVDNMETINENEIGFVKSFLYELPPSTKTIITSRENIGFQPIHLHCLDREDSEALINYKLEEINQGRSPFRISLTPEEIIKIVEKTGGIPLAIIYVIGLLNNGGNLLKILGSLVDINRSRLVYFIFSQSIEQIKNKPAYKLFLIIAVFDDPCTLNAVAHIADIPQIDDNLHDGLIELERLCLVNHSREGMDRYEMLQLTREYARYELSLNPQLEDEIRKRWVDWHLDLVQKYGGEDWAQTQTLQYPELRQEDVNIRAVLQWCSKEHRYGDIKSFWNHIFHYVSLYGNWADHHDWLDYLIGESTLRGDWPNFVEFTNRKSWLLIRDCSSDSLGKARKMLDRAWNLRYEVTDWRIKADIAENLARLHIRAANYETARQYLEEERNYVLGTSSDFEYYFSFLTALYFRLSDCYFRTFIQQFLSLGDQQTRYYLPIIYHEAVINYKEGNYQVARIGFNQVMEQARRINWSRVLNSAQNWLADLAIIQGDRDEAKMHIEQGLLTAKQSLNIRRYARYLRTNAKWEKEWGGIEEALTYAREAEGKFRTLRMESEAEEMSDWIKNLNIVDQTP